MSHRLLKHLASGLTMAVMLMAAACTADPTVTPSPTLDTPTATRPPEATSTSAPTETVAPTATAEPQSEPVALYALADADTLQLFSLTTAGESVDLQQTVYPGAVASSSGRWIAFPATSPPANSVTIRDLTTSSVYTVATHADGTIFGIAFDQPENRLAILGLRPPGVEVSHWEILTVALESGAVARFSGGDFYRDGMILPGFPIGWTASGQELLINTFLPYSDAGNLGLLAIDLPPGAAEAPLDSLPSRVVLNGDAYLTSPRLSAQGSELLYLARDPDYTPADYEPIAFDMAVNQLWSVEAMGEVEPALWLAVDDGSALASAAAWSPAGDRILFAQGHYAGDAFETLTLKIHNGSEITHEVGSVPLAEGEHLLNLYWCHENQALAVTTDAQAQYTLALIDLDDGSSHTVASASLVSVLGCVAYSASAVP